VFSVCGDGCAVGREKIVAGALLATWDELSGKHAEVGTGVDQESQVANSVGDEQAGSGCGTGACRYQRLSLPFPCRLWEHGVVHLRTPSPNRRWYQQRPRSAGLCFGGGESPFSSRLFLE